MGFCFLYVCKYIRVEPLVKRRLADLDRLTTMGTIHMRTDADDNTILVLTLNLMGVPIQPLKGIEAVVTGGGVAHMLT